MLLRSPKEHLGQSHIKTYLPGYVLVLEGKKLARLNGSKRRAGEAKIYLFQYTVGIQGPRLKFICRNTALSWFYL